MKRLYHIFSPAIVAIVLAWVFGFLWFVSTTQRAVDDATTKTDAIIILTGGSDRIREGVELLRHDLAGELFISGVGEGVNIGDLLSVHDVRLSLAPLQPGFASRIHLGYEATNTRGNAQEAAAWLKKRHYGTIRLVTANYHMPRSVLEFTHAMPELVIIPHPVFPEHVKPLRWFEFRWFEFPGTMSLMVLEYNKFIVAGMRLLGGNALLSLKQQ